MIPIYMKKAGKDLTKQKTRAIFILVSITICLSTIGALLNTNYLFNRALQQNLENTNAAELTLYTSPFEEDISSLEKVDGIKEVEAKQQIRARIKINGEFRNFELMAYSANKPFQINKIRTAGQLTPSGQGLLLEKSTLEQFKQSIGDHVMISLPGKQTKELSIDGTVEDFYRIPTRLSGLGYGYLTEDALKNLGLTSSKNLIHVTFESSKSESQVNKIIQEAKADLKTKNITVSRTELSEESLFIRETVVNAILLLLVVLGVVAFLLGFLLITHLFYRIVSEQVMELSIQKVLGATSYHIWKQYSVTLILFGSIVFLTSVPLSGAISFYFSKFIVQELNIGKVEFTYSLKVLVLTLILSFIVPMLAASYPIQKVLKIPVIRGLKNTSRPFVKQKKKHSKRYFHFRFLSIRNAMIKKGQLLTNVLMLSFGGAIIIACIALNNSLLLTLKDMNQFLNYDREWSIQTSLPKEELIHSLEEINGVEQAEAWTIRNAIISQSSSKHNVLLNSVPAQTDFIHPEILEGHWLDKQVPNSIVISSDLSQSLGNIKTGDSLTIQIGNEEKQWKIAGIVKSQLKGPTIYMSQTDYIQWLNNERINRLLIKQDSKSDVQNKVENWFNDNDITIEASDKVEDINSRPEEVIKLIIYSLLFVGILISSVGVLNMTTAMSINVLERKQEIGIIRSLGGSKGKIYQLFIGEGIFIAGMSWVFSVIISYPLHAYLSERIGSILLNSPLHSGMSLNGSLLWLGFSILIGIFASFFPARIAARQPLTTLL